MRQITRRDSRSNQGTARGLVLALGIALAGCTTAPTTPSGHNGLLSDLSHGHPVRKKTRRLASSAKSPAPAPVEGARLAPAEDETAQATHRLAKLGLRWPLETVEVTSPFGRREHEFHEGIDLRAKVGTSVYAAQGGKVIYAGSQIRGYGKMIVIRHSQGLATVYAHNSKLLLHAGDTVKQGDKIALSGMSGRASGPHLHFEIRSGIAAVNPLAMLPRTASVDPSLIRSSGPIPSRASASARVAAAGAPGPAAKVADSDGGDDPRKFAERMRARRHRGHVASASADASSD